MINIHESMWPDRGPNQRPLDSQSDSLPTALGGPAIRVSYQAERVFDVVLRCFATRDVGFGYWVNDL